MSNPPTKQEIQEALTLLLSFEHYMSLKRDIIFMLRIHNAAFTGELEPLNALLFIGREKGEAALSRFWEFLDQKHAETYASTLRNPLYGKTEREYQRRYMNERRRRMTSALSAYERFVGTRLSADNRGLFKETILRAWMKQKEGAFGSRTGGTRGDSQEFWKKIDDMILNALAGDKDACEKIRADFENNLPDETVEQVLEDMWKKTGTSQ